jgi:hypothetical protein
MKESRARDWAFDYSVDFDEFNYNPVYDEFDYPVLTGSAIQPTHERIRLIAALSCLSLILD